MKKIVYCIMCILTVNLFKGIPDISRVETTEDITNELNYKSKEKKSKYN